MSGSAFSYAKHSCRNATKSTQCLNPPKNVCFQLGFAPTPAWWINKLAMSNDGDLALRVFLKKLKKFGVITLAKRGKGADIILVQPTSSKGRQGPQYPIKNHGSNTMIKRPVIKAALRRFGISRDDFWKKQINQANQPAGGGGFFIGRFPMGQLSGCPFFVFRLAIGQHNRKGLTGNVL